METHRREGKGSFHVSTAVAWAALSDFPSVQQKPLTVTLFNHIIDDARRPIVYRADDGHTPCSVGAANWVLHNASRRCITAFSIPTEQSQKGGFRHHKFCAPLQVIHKTEGEFHFYQQFNFTINEYHSNQTEKMKWNSGMCNKYHDCTYTATIVSVTPEHLSNHTIATSRNGKIP
ncbi:hypothetical protein CAPTEDRAFT_206296 [Capitella teleta]|uniref:Uncharacterized protein n=1 Tax=Capitella teleta TaxID=283909 RepID=R7TL40_CAPTE|nr:hypothetical protein CAPTEDRAFT_206296 [Capitella teleta]|eukprot:ELT94563.1 hypothetical protein CAPTEDRAFT_206296 [Capitella teleta]